MNSTERLKILQMRSEIKVKGENHVSISIMMLYDDAIGRTTGHGLDGRGVSVEFPGGARDFSLHHSVKTGSRAHPASYPMGTRGSLCEV
jgi:hypothetical protein